eukprot:scaffold1350_cov249-Pinguiococcus_pyrenoidosus.AAC.18
MGATGLLSGGNVAAPSPSLRMLSNGCEPHDSVPFRSRGFRARGEQSPFDPEARNAHARPETRGGAYQYSDPKQGRSFPSASQDRSVLSKSTGQSWRTPGGAGAPSSGSRSSGTAAVCEAAVAIARDRTGFWRENAFKGGFSPMWFQRSFAYKN